MFMFVTVRADTGWQLASGKHAARAWHNGIVGHYFYFLTAQGKMIGEHILSSFHHLEGFWSIFCNLEGFIDYTDEKYYGRKGCFAMCGGGRTEPGGAIHICLL